MFSFSSDHRSSRGFTLVELMVTIAILAILAAIAAPSITQTMAQRRMKSAAFELQSSILQARALAASFNRQVELWPAYSASWNVAKTSRTGTINIPNANDVSKASLEAAGLSWYVVTPGAATGTSALAIADSTTNKYPIQVSLPEKTMITVGSLPSSASPSASSGLRFSPTGYIGNIATSSTNFTRVSFRICDSAISGEQGYTVIVNPFGGVRTITGPSSDASDTIGSASCS